MWLPRKKLFALIRWIAMLCECKTRVQKPVVCCCEKKCCWSESLRGGLVNSIALMGTSIGAGVIARGQGTLSDNMRVGDVLVSMKRSRRLRRRILSSSGKEAATRRTKSEMV